MSERRAAQEVSLPAGWERVSLGQLLESIETGKSFTADGTPPDLNQVGVMKVSAVTWGVYDETESKTVHDPAQVNPKFFVKPGDLLFSRANTIDLVGAVVLVDRVIRNVMLSDKILRFCMPQEFKKWTLWALRSQLGRRQIKLLATGNQESMRNIGQDRIRQIVIPLPPPLERDRIVSAIETQFSRLDDALASLKRSKANVKRARASVLKAAVEGRLVPTEAALARAESRDYEPASTLLARILTERRARWAESGGKGKYKEPVAPDTELVLPEGWVSASCDQVGDIMLGRQKAPQYLTGKYSTPYLRVANIKDDRIDFSDVDQMDFDDAHLERYRLRPGDILVSEGQSPELVGQSAVYRGGWEKLCFQKALHRFRPLDSGPSTEFAQIVFRAWVRGRVFMRRASITTNIAHLTLEKFKASPFPLPPLAEQRRIVAEVDRRLSVLDALDATLDANLARCAKLRQSILKRAFEGKLVRPDAPVPAAPQLPLFTEEAAP